MPLEDIAGFPFCLTKANWARDRAVSMIQELAVDLNGESCIDVDLVDSEARAAQSL